jgi:hypothetical protein
MSDIRHDAYAEATDAAMDINATDKVFVNVATGRRIKVRTLRVESPAFGVLVYELSGAECDAKGKAIAHGEGWRIAPAQRHTVQGDAPVDLEVHLTRLRIAVAAATERAVELEEAALRAGDSH